MQDKNTRELMDDLAFVTHTLMKKGYEKIDIYLKEFGLVRTHIEIMHSLFGGEKLTMSELSKILGVTKPNITLLVDRLEKLELVERVSTAKDRRVYLIQLSEKGKTFVQEHMNKMLDIFAVTFDKFDKEDLALFKETLSKLKFLIMKL